MLNGPTSPKETRYIFEVAINLGRIQVGRGGTRFIGMVSTSTDLFLVSSVT